MMLPVPPVLIPVQAFAKKHWRGIAIVLALTFAFVSGRYSVPTKVVETSSKKDTQLSIKEKQTSTQETTVKERDVKTKTDRHYVETIDRKPSGEVIITKKLDTDTAKTTDNVQSKQDSKVETQTQVVYKDREVVTTKTVTRDAPKWTVTAALGVPIGLKEPILGTPFVVGSVSHTIWGPLWIGIFGSLNIKGQGPTVGGSLGASF